MPTATRYITRIQDCDDYADALSWAGGVVFNEAGADVDFRVEGVGQVNALFVRGSNGNVGIGTAAPGTKLSVVSPNTDAYTSEFVQLTGRSVFLVKYENQNTVSTANDVGLEFRVRTDAAMRSAVKMLASFSDTADAIRTSEFVFSTSASGTFSENFKFRGKDFLIPNDAGLIKLGDGLGDATIGFDGNSMNIVANAVTGTDELNLTADGVHVTLGSAVASDFTIDATTFVVAGDNGYVGIGTATPNAPLEVKGSLPGNVGGFPSGHFHVTGDGTAEFSSSVITGHSAYNTDTQLWYLGSMSSSNNDIAFINRQNADIHFYTNNTFRMVIDAGGEVGFGTSSPDRLVHAEVSDAVTNAVTYAQRLSHVTSGTAAGNFGTGIEFELEDAGGGNNIAGTLECDWATATAGSERGRIRLFAGSGTSKVEGFRCQAIGAAPGISFFAVGAVVQQNHIVDADGSLANVTSQFNTLLAALEGYGLLKSS